MKHWFNYLAAFVASFALPLGLNAQDGPVLSASITQVAVSAVDYSVGQITVTNGGTGYNQSTVKVTISGGGGKGATATATVVGGVVTSISVVSPGSGYTSIPSVVISDVSHNPIVSTTATATAVVGYSISKIAVVANGASYTVAPIVVIDKPLASAADAQATASASLNADGTVKDIVVNNPGGGYLSAPKVTLVAASGDTTGVGATARAYFGYSVVDIAITQADTNVYKVAPSITITNAAGDSTGNGASAKAIIDEAGAFVGIKVMTVGDSYTKAPIVTVNNDGVVTLDGGGVGFGGGGVLAESSIGSIFAAPFQNESYGPAGSFIIISAQAVGTNPAKGFIYNYYVNGVFIGKALTVPNDEPSRLGWTPPQPGVYYIHAEVNDTLGNTAKTLSVRYFATGTAIQSPLNNTLVPTGSSIVIQASAVGRPQRPNAFVKYMKFYESDANGVMQPIKDSAGTEIMDTTYPYSLIYTPSEVLKDHKIEARAFDNNDNQISPDGTATIDIHMIDPEIKPLPVVSIDSPVNGAPINAETAITSGVSVSVSAASSSNKISRVELYVDGQLDSTTSVYPYKFTWKPTVAGSYNLVALAYDSKNNVVASNSSNVASATPSPTVVIIASPPNASIQSPSSGSTVNEGERTTITATAIPVSYDANNTLVSITKVSFYVDGEYVGESTTASNGLYSASFTPVQKIDSITGAALASAVYAIAYDSNGMSGKSAVVSFNVSKGSSDSGGTTTVGNPPTVSITSPVSSSTIQVNTLVDILANATDSDGKISSVQFYVDGVVQGSADTVYPYATTWTPTSLGSYILTAKAIDNDGNAVKSSSVTVTVGDLSSSAPVVTLLQPSSNGTAVVGTSMNLLASAVDSDGAIKSVQFYVNGQPQGASITTYPFLTAWTPLTPGIYTVAARAIDNVGTIGTSATRTIVVTSGTAPVVSVTAPSEGESINPGEPVRITVSATDADDAIKRVRVFVNNAEIATLTASPYTVSYTPGNSGTFSIVAEATDNAGNITTSAARTFKVKANELPAVTLTSPGSTATLKVGSSLQLKASAIDSDGTIASVAFYVNGTSVATYSAAPYQHSWMPASAGVYTVSAVATDNAGGVSSSASVYVKVVDADTLNTDSIYSGTFSFQSKANPSTFLSGSFAFINASGAGGVFIAYSSDGAKIYRNTGFAISGTGEFSVTSNGSVVLSGQASSTGVSCTVADSAQSPSMIGTINTSTGTVPPGLYNGTVTGRPTTDIAAIVSADGTMTVSVADGSFVDAGRSAVSSSTGSFKVTMVGGSVLSGKIDLSTGFLTATLTGTVNGSVLASNSSVVAINDGSLRNLSARSVVGPNQNTVVGFVVNGTTKKKVLVRAVGPSLIGNANRPTGLTVNDVQTNPNIVLHKIENSKPVQVGANDDWGNNAAIAAAGTSVYAAALDANSKDAALLIDLDPGMYTATASTIGTTSGVTLVELYDIDDDLAFSAQRLGNISARATVGSGVASVHAGFVVSGNSSKKVLIRAVGPTLLNYDKTLNVLADPVLYLRRYVNGAWVDVRENNNAAVGNDASVLAAGVAASGSGMVLDYSKDTTSSELLITLPPGMYSAEVKGSTTATGVAMIEVYEVP